MIALSSTSNSAGRALTDCRGLRHPQSRDAGNRDLATHSFFKATNRSSLALRQKNVEDSELEGSSDNAVDIMAAAIASLDYSSVVAQHVSLLFACSSRSLVRCHLASHAQLTF